MLIFQCLLVFIRRLAVLFLIAAALFSARQLYAQDLTRVILNNNFKGNIAITFYAGVPCLTRPLLEEWGVQKSLVDGLKWTDFGCVMPSSLSVNHIEYWYRPKAGLLTLLIPEPVIIPQQNGVSTSRWDNGINAAFTNYQFSASHEDNRHNPEQNGNALTLDLDNGVNVGPWRMRYKNSLWREQSGDHGSFTREASVYRSFTALRSRMTVGDGYTSNNMFTSLPYRGVALASDEAMFPDSWRPFSPWINGYARSNSDVSIYQNGERVYRIQVPPGPFTIRDFYPPSPDGNLELVIQESNGNERRRTLPYTSMPNLVHYKNFSYEAVFARYRPFHGVDMEKTPFWQATLAWGAFERLTLFAGGQASSGYQSQVVGVGHSLKSLGAISADLSHAEYRSGEDSLRGEVARFRYAKAFFNSETSLSALLQIYPKGSMYRSMAEKLDRDTTVAWLSEDSTTQRSWGSEVLLNQALGEDSSISLGWNHTQNRGNKTASSSLTMSHNSTISEIDLSLYTSYEHSPWVAPETVVGVTLSIPVTIGNSSTNLGYNTRLASRNKDSQGVSLGGTALDDYRLRYAADAQHTVHGNDNLNLGLGYLADAGETNLAYFDEGGRRRWRADASGSVVLHNDGVTLGQTLGDTAGLATIPQGENIGVYNQFGSKTNSKGEVLVSYLTPWRVNRIIVDSADLPEDKEIQDDMMEVIPTRGAIVKAKFAAPIKRESITEDRGDSATE